MALSLFITETSLTSPSPKMARALELLEKNKKTEALKFLESAFAESIDPVEMKHLAVLILEASPLNYQKREAFLKYLVRFSPQHSKYPDWLKELGDRSFQAGEMDAAEDWYLRASVFAKAPEAKARINYQLSLVYSNKKNLTKAFELMNSAFEDSERLRPRLHSEIAKLWWPQMKTLKIRKSWGAWSESDKQLLVKELLKSSKAASLAERKIFFELMAENEWSKTLLIQEIMAKAKSFHEPCLVFEVFLKPSDPVSEDLIFACLNSEKNMNQPRLLEFVEALHEQGSEQLHLAHIDLLVQTKQKTRAANLGLKVLQNLSAQTKFFEILDDLLLSLSDGEWLDVAKPNQDDLLKNFMRLHPQAKIIVRLQMTRPEVWFSFQEQEIPASLDKSFWVRKANWQLTQKLTEEDLNFYLEKILSFHPDVEEKKIQLTWQKMQESDREALPIVFGKDFLKAFEKKIKDLDQRILDFQKSQIAWRELAEIHMRSKVQHSLSLLRKQVIDLQMPTDFTGHADEFSEKKQGILSSLSQKYSRWELKK